MLASKSLWFAKAAQLHDDPYEGFCLVTERDAPLDEYGPRWVSDVSIPEKAAPISVERMVAEFSHMSAEYLRSAREHLYVNSWCLADESMAMWQIYGSSGRGIAVKSSVGQYRRAVRLSVKASQFATDKVQYQADLTESSDVQFDFRHGSVPVPGFGVWECILKLAFNKRICFEYEKEWRGALYQDNRQEPGCNIEFDLDELISAVYIGPRAEEFFFDVVSSVMEKFQLRKPLEKSALLQLPPRKRGAATE